VDDADGLEMAGRTLPTADAVGKIRKAIGSSERSQAAAQSA
jgi:hypothetical protein